MPSTFTANLGFEKQATGENNNTWGNVLNTVLDDIDTAIAGFLQKSVAGSSDVTLTAAEALNMVHQYTGALTGNINVIVPTSAKLYYCENATTGSFTLTVKTSGGTGITLDDKTKVYALYCDGTNVIEFQDAQNDVINTQGDIPIGDANGASARLPVGSNREVLESNGTTASWQPKWPTGISLEYTGSVAPAGFVLEEGGTIGSAMSSATERANDDTEALFTHLWNELADAQAPVSGGRGASAAADWAADKTITVPDHRGRMGIGVGQGPDTAEGGGAGITRVMGEKNGKEEHTLVIAEMPAHTHKYGNAIGQPGGAGALSLGFGSSGTTTSTGGNGAHTIMNPTVAKTFIMAL